jgi:threonyl-tRNA synthetase
MEKVTQAELEAMRHTAAHVLAAASTRLKPDTKLGVGPVVEDGFYHDIDVDERYTEADLEKLENAMREIVSQDLPIKQREVSKEEARTLFAHDPYKLELIEELPGETVGVSDMGDGFFVTLCKGGHAASTGKIGAFKLTRLAGVYWKGDAANQQLQRVYGVLFPTQKELKAHLTMLEEARKRDHRKLGKALDLFTFSPLVGAGLPMFTPRGTLIRQELNTFLWSIQGPLGYQQVTTPHMAKTELYKTSGHWDKFHNDLFLVKSDTDEDEDGFVMKPMNCPHHIQIYVSKKRSYRELPLRYAEVTTVYRNENAGQLQGLTRVRSITQDDAHIFCRADQIESEVERAKEVVSKFYAAFDFKLHATLSLRDPAQKEKYLGSDEVWEKAEGTLRSILQKDGAIFEEFPGEAAFYGPKIDFIATDSIGRKWQLATVQLDFNQPQRFELTYTDAEGKEVTPVMIHRAISGSVERFMGILLEHYAGALPVWLSPAQVAILPISDEQHAFAQQVLQELVHVGIRAELDDSSDTVGKKIRKAETMKVPVMFVIGKKEVADNTVTIRKHGSKDQTVLSVNEAIAALQHQIQTRS